MKTGSMFGCRFEDETELNETLRVLNRRFTEKGLRFLPLRYEHRRALIYVYRPNRLKEDLKNEISRDLLEKAGYACGSANACVTHLIKRMKATSGSEEFPHEIGLFLSYPPKDVAGFIENHARDYKLVGNWKVYDDEEAARKTFAKYQKCKDVYCRQWEQGRTMEQLTVAG